MTILSNSDPKDHFTVGINDDVTHTSLTTMRRSQPSPTA